MQKMRKQPYQELVHHPYQVNTHVMTTHTDLQSPTWGLFPIRKLLTP